MELGLSEQAVQHRIVRGRLYRIERGVYAVGRPALTKRGRWMAAVLGCGPDALLSHWSAAALFGLGFEKQQIEVSVRTCSDRKRGGAEVLVHRRRHLQDEDCSIRDAIPVTSPVRTLVDLAATSGRDQIERLVNEADRLDLVDPEVLSAALSAYRGQRGVARLRAVVDPGGAFRRTRSGLERRFLRLVERAGLPMPLTRKWLNGFEVDFYWPDLGLVVETDGLRYHRTAARQAKDRRRDQAHTVAGLTQLRFTEAQVEFEAGFVVETLRGVVGRLSSQ
jgi:very-short-patch-repair endonuclease